MIRTYVKRTPEGFSGKVGTVVDSTWKGTRPNCLNIVAIRLNAIRNGLVILVVLQLLRINYSSRCMKITI
jgi:hypothetical protein